jgi:hypothetical protein
MPQASKAFTLFLLDSKIKALVSMVTSLHLCCFTVYDIALGQHYGIKM